MSRSPASTDSRSSPGSSRSASHRRPATPNGSANGGLGTSRRCSVAWISYFERVPPGGAVRGARGGGATHGSAHQASTPRQAHPSTTSLPGHARHDGGSGAQRLGDGGDDRSRMDDGQGYPRRARRRPGGPVVTAAPCATVVVGCGRAHGPNFPPRTPRDRSLRLMPILASRVGGLLVGPVGPSVLAVATRRLLDLVLGGPP